MTVRRIKSYSAGTGYVYQYYFESVRPEQKRGSARGDEYVFIVSRDRKHNFEVPVLLTGEAVRHWAGAHGRELGSPEQYAAVKMRLFQAFDETPEVEAEVEGNRLGFAVTPENIGELLAQLEIE